ILNRLTSSPCNRQSIQQHTERPCTIPGLPDKNPLHGICWNLDYEIRERSDRTKVQYTVGAAAPPNDHRRLRRSLASRGPSRAPGASGLLSFGPAAVIPGRYPAFLGLPSQV